MGVECSGQMEYRVGVCSKALKEEHARPYKDLKEGFGWRRRLRSRVAEDDDLKVGVFSLRPEKSCTAFGF